ncbi:Neurotransmitter-gated ion-channel transmembrane region [Parelaphostrongylus tenuis]|uniref:Neurotransmitter-gated ion-channel transmembrane region n=1 Tax=Parelaphostrongylus tenuis TaxID=148309 RepID=A0AAD5LXM6_PARTN|nr:Neurotransmitter-gated ion-channel transmembrane region [Parelaphostrongylus tenuis]
MTECAEKINERLPHELSEKSHPVWFRCCSICHRRNTVSDFFKVNWYCAVGHNPCGQINLKCPWMAVTPNDPQCDPNPYN